MNVYVIQGIALKIVREPHYPHLVTLLAEDRALLDGAHPGGPGAVCASTDPDFPFALHAERWALPREFWALRDVDIPLLDSPVTPDPLCWRFEGLRHQGPAGDVLSTPEAFSGYVSHDERLAAEDLFAQHLIDVAFYPWFEQVCPSTTPLRERIAL